MYNSALNLITTFFVQRFGLFVGGGGLGGGCFFWFLMHSTSLLLVRNQTKEVYRDDKQGISSNSVNSCPRGMVYCTRTWPYWSYSENLNFSDQLHHLLSPCRSVRQYLFFFFFLFYIFYFFRTSGSILTKQLNNFFILNTEKKNKIW